MYFSSTFILRLFFWFVINLSIFLPIFKVILVVVFVFLFVDINFWFCLFYISLLIIFVVVVIFVFITIIFPGHILLWLNYLSCFMAYHNHQQFFLYMSRADKKERFGNVGRVFYVRGEYKISFRLFTLNNWYFLYAIYLWVTKQVMNLKVKIVCVLFYGLERI